MEYTGMEVAVVGVAVRFPGAENIDELWDSLINGRVMIRHFSDEELLARGVKPELLENPNYVKAYGELKNKEYFDASFFGYTPIEAEKMLPQMRLLHEIVWAAIEDAGFLIPEYPGKIGLYLGANSSAYWEAINTLSDNNDMFAGVSSSTFVNKDHAAARIAYNLNLTGPSLIIDTACSTSLVAVHQACQALLAGDCDMAVSGGISISGQQDYGYLYQEGDIYSKDGRCRPFDRHADGTVRGDGGGAVVLKLLEKARKDGDHIYAIVKGSAINNDGRLKVGYTAPSAQGQADVIQKALLASEVAGETVTYIETHGTGTQLGDAIEIEGLKGSYGRNETKCHLGSLKANIGHLIHGAGIAGFIKAILCLQHKMIPPMVNFKSPNPAIDYSGCPFVIDKVATKWEGGSPLRAGVSSFGIGGTNAHVILEQAPDDPAIEFEEGKPNVIIFSAKEEEAVRAAAGKLESFLQSERRNLSAVAYTYQMKRQAFKYRTSLAYANRDDLIERLGKGISVCQKSSHTKRICFLFAGQGTQYLNMGLGLYRQNRRFRALLDQCLALYEQMEHKKLIDIVYVDSSASEAGLINNTEYTQPLLFSFEYALAMYLMEIGVKPDNMVGHSIGEYTAACIAGTLSLEDAMKLVVHRAKLMQGAPKGCMVSVDISQSALLEYLLPGISIAAVNTSKKCVISGEEILIAHQSQLLEQLGYRTHKLRTSHAFHSSLMEPVMSDYAKVVATVKITEPSLAYMSNLSGDQVEYDAIKEPVYWSNHIRSTVWMEKSLNFLLTQQEDWIFIEIGPGRTLGSFVTQHDSFVRERHSVFSTMRHPKEEADDAVFFFDLLGKLWSCGVEIKWDALYDGIAMQKLPAPTYPFQGKRYWIDKSIDDIMEKKKSGGQSPAGSKNPNISQWFYVPDWSKAPISAAGKNENDKRMRILVFTNEDDVSARILNKLSKQNHVIVVYRGSQFQKINDSLYTIAEQCHETYLELYEEVLQSGDLDAVVNLWCLAQETVVDDTLSTPNFYKAQHYGLYVLLYAAKNISAISPASKVFLLNVTQQMEDASGDECVQSHYSTVISPIKCIPQEFANFRCKNVDVVLTDNSSADYIAESIYQETRIKDCDHEIAYRNGHRLCRTYTKVELPECRGNSAFRHGGTYWITGGTGFVGMQIADYLAKVYTANILLLGKGDYPDKQDWEAWFNCEDIGREKALFVDLKNKSLERKTLEFDTVDYKKRYLSLPVTEYKYDEFDNEMNVLCAIYAFRCLDKMESQLVKGVSYTEHGLLEKTEIIKPLCKYFRLFMRVLENAQYIIHKADRVVFTVSYDQLPDQNRLLDELSARYPEYRGTICLLKLCGDALYDVLRGEVPSTSVLFPTGDTKFLEGILGKNKVENSNTILFFNEIKSLMEGILSKTNKKVRILEVGGGSGQLLKNLSDLFSMENVEYYFTDISENFIDSQRKYASERGWDFIRFQKFDISKDAYTQDYKPAQFDVILAYDVVHAAPDLREAVTNLSKLLVPQGLLLLLEDVKQRTWLDMIWGYASGWWSYTDEDMRVYSPIATSSQWEKVLQDCGLENVIVPGVGDCDDHQLDVALIIGQRKQGIILEEVEAHYPLWKEEVQKIRNVISRLQAMNRSSGNVTVKSVDLSDEDQLNAVTNDCRLEWGEPNGLILAAGKTSDYRIIEQKETDKDYFNSFLAPKVDGMIQFDRILRSSNLDFRMVVSSISSVFGGLAYTAYTAGHLFSDAHAIKLGRIKGQRWISVNWNSWSNWIKEESSNQLARLYQQLAMTSEESMDAFERTLCNASEVVWACFPGDFYGMEQVWLKEMNTYVGVSEDLPDAKTPAVNEDLDSVVSGIWRDMFGVAKIDPNLNFFEMGGDSLKAISILNKINQLLDTNISLKVFYDYPTISSMSSYIENEAGILPGMKIEKAPQMEYYRTSAQQKRMFALYKMNPDSLVYNETLVLAIRGELDLDKMEMAIKQVIDLHECLRTSIILVEDEIVQKIWDDVDFKVVRIETSMHDAENITRSLVRPFTMSSQTMLRAYVLKIEPQLHRLVLDMPHVVTDMISSKLLLRDLLLCYKGTPPLKAPIQYKDYAHSQGSEKYSELLERQKSFWISEYSTELTPLSIPYDYDKRESDGFRGDTYTITIKSDVYQSIRSFVESERVTLFVFLFTQYVVLLSKICDADDVVVGTPVINRRNEQLFNTMGMFVNTIAIRTLVDHNTTITNLLHTVMEKCIQCFDNQEYDFLQLVNEIVAERSFNQHSIFNVMFVLLNDEGQKSRLEEVQVEGLNIEDCDYTAPIAKYDLMLTAKEENNSLKLSFQYNTDVFRDTTIIRFAQYYTNLINVVLKGEDKTIWQIDMLSAEERSELLCAFNDTDRNMPNTRSVTSFFREQVQSHPHSVALIHNSQELSYLDLDNRSSVLARYLRNNGVSNNVCVCLLANRGFELMVGVLGILKAGGVYVPIDPALPTDRKSYIINDCGARILLMDQYNFADPAADACAEYVCIQSVSLQKEQIEKIDDINVESDLAYIIYTSGTTGAPKGVGIEHRSIINRLKWMEREYHLGTGHTILLKTSISFDVSIWELFFWFYADVKVAILDQGEEKDPQAIIDCIKECRVTALHFVPSMLRQFLNFVTISERLGDIGSLCYTFSSGESLPLSTVDLFNDTVYPMHGTQLVNLYGPTEATIDVTSYNCSTNPPFESVPIGKPIDNTRIYIVDRRMQLRPIGAVGEICLAGIGLARGYINKKELTSERFVNNPFENDSRLYKTGDYGSWLPDGNIRFLGRIDKQVKIRGYRIEIGEIESALLLYKGVTSSAVLLEEGPNESMSLHAYCETPGSDVTEDEIHSHLMNILPVYMLPSIFTMLRAFPRLSSGKIDRNALSAISEQISISSEEKNSEYESYIHAVWSQVLGKKISVNDNFFRHGGDSIKAIQLINLLGQDGYSVRIKDVFDFPTVAQFSQVLRKSSKKKQYADVIGKSKLTPIQKAYFSMNLQGQMLQTLMLFIRSDIDEKFIRQAIQTIYRHHDALRTVFIRENNGEIVQLFRPYDDGPVLDFINLSGRTDQTEVMQAAAESAKAGINAMDGPLCRFILFHTDGGCHLFMAIHHLVMDAVSWHILLIDLWRLLKQGKRGEEMKLNSKTDSYLAWSNTLYRKVQENSYAEDLQYWKDVYDWGNAHRVLTSTNMVSKGGIGKVSIALTSDESAYLINSENRQRTIDDILITAIGLGIKKAFECPAFSLAVEGHGREEIDKDLDISSTVGWFTCLYQIPLDFSAQSELIQHVSYVATTIRNVPNQGISYGILRYLAGAFASDDAVIADVCYNNLGDITLAEQVDDRVIELSDYRDENTAEMDKARLFPLEFTASVVEKTIQVSAYYNARFSKQKMLLLMQSTKETLEKYIRLIQEGKDTELQFDYSGLSTEDIDSLFD